jgi:hypothetical protein
MEENVAWPLRPHGNVLNPEMQMQNQERRPVTAADEAPDSRSADLARVGQQIQGRLTSLGVSLDGAETPDQLRQIADAVERFEDAVEARGGDLMVDEPPRGKTAEPDDPDFVLPRRAADESVRAYVDRLERATRQLRSRSDDTTTNQSDGT